MCLGALRRRTYDMRVAMRARAADKEHGPVRRVDAAGSGSLGGAICISDEKALGGGTEGETDAACGLDNAGGDFQQAKPQRRELRGGQFPGFGNGITYSEHQPIGAVWRTRRTWLASAERQLVRSEASWVLCSLIRFSAWPRAQ
jgi:hypothetical protein